MGASQRACYGAAMKRSAIRLPRWQSLWLAGWLRHREGPEPLPDPPAELARWRVAGSTPEQRVLQRAADLLGESAERLPPALRRAGWALAALCLLIGLLGAAGVFTLLGRGDQPVNVVWAWLALLGPHLLMFLLWMVGLFAGAAPPWSGRSLLALGERVPGLFPDRDLLKAAWDGLAQAGLGRWLLSALSHLLWMAALGGALIGLLLALSLRRYGFTWETTILPAAWFESLVGALAWLPGQLGFPQPGTDLVAASGESPVASDVARRAWSFWLVGGLLVYGLLPRALALLLCRWRMGRALRALQLPWQQPYYALLARRLAPRSTRLGIADADAGSEAPVHWVLGGVGEGAAAVGLDLPAEWPWPPEVNGLLDLGRCETREQRARALHRLCDHPAAKLLVVVEAAQSPDRGALGWIGELAAHCRSLAVLAAGPDRDGRGALWRDALRARGLADSCLPADAGAAARWLAEAQT